MSEYICNLIIPGAAKSGTSSLHKALGQHPAIYPSTPKEPQFFSFDERYRDGAARHNKIFPNPGDEKYFMESSQCYFAHENAMDRIQSSLNDIRIIIALRHPVDRLLSQYKWNYRRATETDPFKKAITERGNSTEYVFDRRIKVYREVGGYLAFSRYSVWVPDWISRFGKDSVFLVDFLDLQNNQSETLKRCYEFLGISEVYGSLAKENTTEKTTTVVPPVYLKIGARLTPQFIKKSKLYDDLKRVILTQFTPEPNISSDSATKQFIYDELKEDIRFYESIRFG